MSGGWSAKRTQEVYNGWDGVHMVNGFSRQCNTSSLLTTCPFPGEDTFVNEDSEAQGEDISHSFRMTTRSAVGSIYGSLVMLIHIYDLDRVGVIRIRSRTTYNVIRTTH
jgi:hypothetical protein